MYVAVAWKDEMLMGTYAPDMVYTSKYRLGWGGTVRHTGQLSLTSLHLHPYSTTV